MFTRGTCPLQLADTSVWYLFSIPKDAFRGGKHMIKLKRYLPILAGFYFYITHIVIDYLWADNQLQLVAS